MDTTWGDTAQYAEVAWPWPIAVYLFLAGLSAGALIISVLLRRRSLSHDEGCSCFVRAGAFLAPVTIVLGLVLLVVDLTKPLNFYQLLFNWNLSSVMSLGTGLLVVYTPVSLLYALTVFKDRFAPGTTVRRVADAVDTTWLHVVSVTLAAAVGIYTGFLLSAMVAVPLYNVAVLPLLFLVSGISAGIAATVLLGLVFARTRGVYRTQLGFSSNVDSIMIMVELAILFLMFVGLYYQGGAHAQAGRSALSDGVWGWVFWVGVIGAGIVVPLALHYFGHHDELPGNAPLSLQVGRVVNRYPQPDAAVELGGRLPVLTLTSAGLVLVGSLLLRLFIVYAGQLPV